MIKTTYQRPELRDANDNIIQSGSFGKNTALSNATNDGWIDYTMNDLEALHDSMSSVETVTTPKVATSNYTGKIWFSDASNGARLCRTDDFWYNPSLGRLRVPEIQAGGNPVYPIINGGYYTFAGSVNGRIIIKLPFSMSSSTGLRMFRFAVDIYKHQDALNHDTIVIAGANRISTLEWYATSTNAYTIGVVNSIVSEQPIVFGNDGTYPYVAIGNADNAWGYCRIVVRDLMGVNPETAFDITVSDAELQNVDIVKRYTNILEPADGATTHNSPHRAKPLGSSITDEQLAAIRNGTFRGISVGDYWTINGYTWYVGGINYFMTQGTGSANYIGYPHLVIVPAQILYTARMNATATNEGGYVSSELFAGLEENALPIIEAAFGANNIMSMYRRLPSTCVGGEYTASADYNGRKVDIMNEAMVFGSHSCGQNRYSDGSLTTQLPIFRYRRDIIRGINTDASRTYYWLYDVVGTQSFAVVYYDATRVSYTNANVVRGVRPFFCIG